MESTVSQAGEIEDTAAMYFSTASDLVMSPNECHTSLGGLGSDVAWITDRRYVYHFARPVKSNIPGFEVAHTPSLACIAYNTHTQLMTAAVGVVVPV